MKRVAKILGYTLVGLPVFALGLVTLVFLLLMIPPLRALAVKQGVAYTNESVLEGMTLKVKAVDRIDPWGINARGIELFDDQERLFVGAPWVLVRLKPWSLISNKLRITRAEIDGAEVHIYAPEPKPPEPEEPPSEPSTFVVQAENARVRGFQFYMDLSGRELHATVGTLRAGGQYGPKIAAAITELTARATIDDEEALTLKSTGADWDAEKGGKISLQGSVAGAPLTLAARVRGLDDMEPWPIESATLRLQGVSRRALALAGLQDGMELKTPLDLTLDAKADTKQLEAKLKLTARKIGAVAVQARADDDTYAVDIGISPMQLRSVAGGLPVLKLQGDIDVRATHGKDMLPRKIDLRWNGVFVDDGAVPPGVVKAQLALPLVKLDSLQMRGLEDKFGVHGEYDLDRGRGKGAVEFHQLQLSAIEALKKMGIAGLLDGALSASYTPPSLGADGNLTVRDFAHPSAQLQALDLGIAVGGTLSTPQGHFKVKLSKLAAGDLKLDKLSADAQANPRTMTAKLEMSGPDTGLRAEIGGQRTQSGLLRLQGIGRGQFKKKEVRFDLRELTYGDQGLALQQLALFSGKQSVQAEGTLDKDDGLDVQLAIKDIDLATWADLADLKQLTGKIGGTVQVDGTTSLPRVDAKLKLDKVAYQADIPIDGTIDVKGDLNTRKAELTLGLYSSSELGARGVVQVAIPKKPAALGDAMLLAKVHSDLNIYMPVIQISALAGDQLAGLDGMLTAKILADGTLEDPHLDADITAELKLPEQTGNPEEALHLTAKADKDQFKLNLWTKDDEGDLLRLDGEVQWPGGSPRAAIEHPAGWRNAHFYTQASLQPRRLDMMQGVFAYFTKLYALDLPLRTSALITLRGDDGVLDGSAKLQATIFGDKLDGRCRIGAQSNADIDAKLEQDKIEVELGVKTDGGGMLKGKLESVLALNALEGTEPVIGPARVTLEGEKIALYRMPGLCNLAAGDVGFKIEATGLGKDRPALDLNAKIEGLRAPGMPAMDVVTWVKAGGEKAELKMSMKGPERDVGYIEGSVPLSYPNGSTTPTVLPDAPLKAKLQLAKLELANVLAFTESLGRVRGTASANFDVTGKLNDPQPNGYIELEKVDLSIASLAQPLRDIDGRIEVKGRSVNIKKLTAHDRGGKVVIDGFANMAQDMTGDAGLYIEAEKFPLRQQGTIVGELTLRARADAKIPADQRVQAQLKIVDGRIWLTGDRGKSVQSLDAHPDVHYSDEKQDDISDTEQAKQVSGGGGITLGSFTMKTESELWLMHKDFTLQVGVDIKLSQSEAGPKLEGQATLVRGELKLLGKPFTLKKGAIRFTGDMPPDPELDITAVYSPPSGQDLIVKVSGRGSMPVLEFGGAATDIGEAVAILTGVGASKQSSQQQDAASQVAGMAADMTAGLLVMTARREFGDWVPMISVETGQSGTPRGASAGFDASKLIPNWARGFARGAYVEGTVGQQSERGGTVGVGVKLEVALPHDLVTELGYRPTGWNTDIAWAP
ncbi:MAG TPA: translocation/assembly module TamB domain-containing protein [Polyangiales bacterium]|nr:translocation/assembly module TamB domain-containing protein [Polyangiales bacterium]